MPVSRSKGRTELPRPARIETPQDPHIDGAGDVESGSGPPANDASVHGASNSFEDAARAAFVAGQATDAPAGGRNVLQTMLQGAPADTAPLAALAAGVPPPSRLGRDATKALVQLVQDRVAEAAATGRAVRLAPSELDKLLEPAWSSAHEGYGAIAAQLAALGLKTSSDGFIGVSIGVEKSTSAPAGMSRDAFAAELAARLPGPPGKRGVGEQLAALIHAKLDEAVRAGENRIRLDTSALDPLLDGTPITYEHIADELKRLGYRAGSDGFVGVSASWDKPASGATPTQQELLGALASGVKLTTDDGAVASLVDLIAKKIAGAGRDRSFDLPPRELDPLLKAVFGSAHHGYDVVAAALKGKGFKAFADGFIGVSASWS